MTTLTKRPLLIGSATLAAAFFALSLSSSAQAAMSAREFIASLDELKQVCHHLHQPMWFRAGDSGCGKVVKCEGRKCYYKPKVRIPNPNQPPGIVVLVRKDGADRNHDKAGRSGGEKDSGDRGNPNGIK